MRKESASSIEYCQPYQPFSTIVNCYPLVLRCIKYLPLLSLPKYWRTISLGVLEWCNSDSLGLRGPFFRFASCWGRFFSLDSSCSVVLLPDFSARNRGRPFLMRLTTGFMGILPWNDPAILVTRSGIMKLSDLFWPLPPIGWPLHRWPSPVDLAQTQMRIPPYPPGTLKSAAHMSKHLE